MSNMIMPRTDVPSTREGDFEPSASEARLLDEARRGHEASFGELVNRYQRRLQRVIGRFIRDEEQVADLTQETFLRAYQRLAQFDPSRRFGPWLFQIGVNLTLDYLRQRKRRIWWSPFSQQRGEKPMDPAMADPRGTLDTQQEVRAVLERIPEKYRTVLVLRDIENFSTSEIAAVLGRTEATIRWRLSEARQRFAELWAKQTGQTPSSSSAQSSNSSALGVSPADADPDEDS